VVLLPSEHLWKREVVENELIDDQQSQILGQPNQGYVAI